MIAIIIRNQINKNQREEKSIQKIIRTKYKIKLIYQTKKKMFFKKKNRNYYKKNNK